MFNLKNILPLPRQRIYKIYFLDFIKDFFLLNFRHGVRAKELESKILELTNSNYGLALNRGRIGAYLAVKSIISKKKYKVILSPFTIFDIVNMVICAGATPIFTDINKETLTIDYENILNAYDEHVAAILITHTHKINKNIDEIVNFAKKNNVIIIEDCAISFGTQYKNSYIGTLGDIGFYSFGMFKFISSLNGGFILAKNKKTFIKIYKIQESFNQSNFFQLLQNYLKAIFIIFFTSNLIFKFITNNIVRFGHLNNIKFINKFTKNDPKVKFTNKLPNNYKIKISNHQALSIIKQLEYCSKNHNIRKKNAEIYYNELKDIKEISIPIYYKNTSDGWINFPIQYENRDDLLNFLFKNNRDLAKYFYRNCNDLEIFANYQRNLPIIKDVVNNLIILPTYPSYDIKQVYKNISLIKKYFEYL